MASISANFSVESITYTNAKIFADSDLNFKIAVSFTSYGNTSNRPTVGQIFPRPFR